MTKKEECLKKLRELDNRGKTITAKVKGTNDEKEIGVIDDLVYQMAGENRYEIQRIKLRKGGIEYRICYYTCDANDTHPHFAQYAPIMNESDFSELINKAKEKGWLNE